MKKKEKKPIPSAPVIGVQLTLVCDCGHTDLTGRLEMNFADNIMYFKCSKCKKMNILDFSIIKQKPYPKPTIGRTW